MRKFGKMLLWASPLLMIPIFVGLAFAQGWTTTQEFSMPEVIVVLTGLVSPLLIKFVTGKVKSSLARWWIAMIISALWGIIGVSIAKKWDSGNWATTIMLVIMAGQLSFKNVWHLMITGHK